jgi:hypothetical protein
MSLNPSAAAGEPNQVLPAMVVLVLPITDVIDEELPVVITTRTAKVACSPSTVTVTV